MIRGNSLNRAFSYSPNEDPYPPDEMYPEEYDRPLLPAVFSAAALAGAALFGAKLLRSSKGTRTLGSIENVIKRIPGINRILPIYEGTEYLSRNLNSRTPGFREALARRSFAVTPELQNLDRLLREGKARYGQYTSSAIQSALEKMATGPATRGELRQATLKDVVYKGALRDKIYGISSESAYTSQLYTSVMQSAPGRAALARMGTTKELLAGQIPLGRSLFVDEATKGISDVGRFDWRNVMEKVFQIPFPFLPQFKPFQLLAPTELIRTPPVTGWINKAVMGASTGRGDANAFYAGGKVFPIEKAKKGEYLKFGKPLAGSYRIGEVRSGMYRGAAARMGVNPGYGSLSNYLEARGEVDEKGQLLRDLITKKELKGQLGKLIRGKVDRKTISDLLYTGRIKALEFGEKVGIGPQFSLNQSRVGGMATSLINRAKHSPTIPSEFREGVLERIPDTGIVSRLKKWAGIPAPQGTDLTWFQRQKLKLGIQPKTYAKFLRDESGKFGTPFEGVTKVPLRHFAPESTAALRERPETLGRHYIWPEKGGTKRGLKDWANFQMIRPLWLMEEMTGMNIVPGKEWHSTLLKSLAKVALPAAVGYSALGYGDYVAGKVGLPGPKTAAAWAYTRARLGLQASLDALGVPGLASDLEEQYPGLISSPLSKVSRAAVSVLGGVAAGKLFGFPIAGLVAGLAAGTANLVDITQPYEQLRRIYSGEEKVPIRRGRWWSLGRQPFEGEDVLYYRHHWYHQLRTKYKDIALYGSEKAAWEHGSWLPTPTNWFGLKRLWDPHYLEKRHYYTRPYPITSGIEEDIPIIGPALASPLSPLNLVKPKVRMHPEYWEGGTVPDVTPGVGTGTVGMGPVGPDKQVGSRLASLTGEQVYNIQQWMGLPGFFSSFASQQIFGQNQYFTDPQLATSGDIASAQRGFYDAAIGGALGQSELIRRFLPRGRKIDLINPIPNNMPSWLPGSRSYFSGDREFMDFHKGDPYTLVASGEARLPGPGYEALNRMHSGVPGYYDPMDRFLVLADIAPFSDSYKHHKEIVKGWVNSGGIDRYWQNKYYEALQQVEEKAKPHFKEDKFDRASLHDVSVTIKDVISPTSFIGDEGRTYQLAGIDKDPDLAKWRLQRLGKDLGAVDREYKTIYEKLLDMQGKTVHMRLGSPGMAKEVPVIIPGINEGISGMSIAKPSDSPADAQSKFGSNVTHRLWSSLRNVSLPGPLGWPGAKFFNERSAMAEYQMTELEGGGFAGWDNPYRNFIRFWGRQTFNMFRSTPAIPSEVKERRELEEYFDKVEFLKNKRLQKQANMAGDRSLERYYALKSKKTMAGLDMNSPDLLRSAFSAIPKTERNFFKSFVSESSPEGRQKILDMVPEYMQPIYMGVWKSQNVGPHNFDTTPSNAMKLQNLDNTFEIASFFQKRRLPDANWAGWNPGIDLAQVRYKTVENVAESIQDFEVWENQVQTARYAPIAPFSQSPRDITTDYIKENFMTEHEKLARLNSFGIMGPSPIMPIQSIRRRKYRYPQSVGGY